MPSFALLRSAVPPPPASPRPGTLTPRAPRRAQNAVGNGGNFRNHRRAAEERWTPETAPGSRSPSSLPKTCIVGNRVVRGIVCRPRHGRNVGDLLDAQHPGVEFLHALRVPTVDRPRSRPLDYVGHGSLRPARANGRSWRPTTRERPDRPQG